MHTNIHAHMHMLHMHSPMHAYTLSHTQTHSHTHTHTHTHHHHHHHHHHQPVEGGPHNDTATHRCPPRRGGVVPLQPPSVVPTSRLCCVHFNSLLRQGRSLQSIVQIRSRPLTVLSLLNCRTRGSHFWSRFVLWGLQGLTSGRETRK